MPDQASARLRHAQYFAKRLTLLDDQYLGGRESSLESLKLFDVDWQNVKHAHNWAIENIAIDSSAATLCHIFSDGGAFCIDVRLSPRDLIYWREYGLDAAKRLDDSVSESIHYGNLGLTYYVIGDLDKARECFLQQEIISKMNKSYDLVAIAKGNLGCLDAELGNGDEGIKSLTDTLNYFKAKNDLYYEAMVLGCLGNACLSAGISLGVSHYLESIITTLNNAEDAGQLNNIYFPNLKNIDPTKIQFAQRYYSQCLEISRKIGDLRSEGSALGSLGFVYFLLGNIEPSLAHLNEAVTVYSNISFRQGLSTLLGFAALVHKTKGEFETALQLHMEQLTIIRELQLGFQAECVVLFSLGDIYTALENRKLAREYYQHGLSLLGDQRFVFPKINFNLIASSKKRYEIDAVGEQIDLILRQTKRYFEKAGFTLQQENEIDNSFVVSASELPNHKVYGNIYVQVFLGELTGEKLRTLYEGALRQNQNHSQLAYAVYEDDVSVGAFHQIYTFSLESNITIVPLESSLIAQSLSLNPEQLYLNLYALEQKYISHSNPYDQTNAVSDPTVFFGRQKETDAIIKRLKSIEHVGIFGNRKIGKTSFLNHVKRRLITEKIAVAYIGLQAKAYTPYRLFEDIVRQLRDYLALAGITNLPKNRFLSLTNEKKAAPVFRDEILELFHFARESAGIPLFVIMIDEVERIVPINPNDDLSYLKFDEFFSPIRDLSQTYRCVVSVVSGERATIREEFPGKYSNTMFELYQPIYLSCFNLEECSEMVVKLGKIIGLEYTKEGLERIFDETGGHPYITRVLCSCLAEHVKTGMVDDKDISVSVGPSLEKLNEYFRGWWLKTANDEKQLIKLILNKNPSVENNLVYSEALRTLKQHGIVYQSQETLFHIAPHLLTKWLLQRGIQQDG
jgi:tetratricopeptide (TPR) repeat protein